MPVLKLKDYAAYMGKLSRGEFYQRALAGVRQGARRALPLLHDRTRRAPPASPNGAPGAFSSGHFLRAWKVEDLPNGAKILNDAPYSGVVEHGRRKGARMPPPRVLEHWARRRMGLSQQEAKRAAFAIARAISRRGLKGRKILTGAERDIAKLVHEEIIRELQKVK